MNNNPSKAVPGIVPARYGKAFSLSKGQTIKVVSEYGTQVLDLWAFNAADMSEFMSMEHTRSRQQQDHAWRPETTTCPDTCRRPMLRVTEDTFSPGIRHATMRLQPLHLRRSGLHRISWNCSDNLHEALREVGLSFPVHAGPAQRVHEHSGVHDHSISRMPPTTKPGDYVRLKAEMDLIVVISACPQDMTVINGADRTPRDVHYVIES